MSYSNQPVESSNVSSISYDDKTRELQVTFKKGSTYTYSDVPQSVGNAMPYTSSKGKFVHEVLKNYPYSRD